MRNQEKTLFPDFEYLKPRNLKEALQPLGELGERCRLLAGGTALLVDVRDGHVSPELLVDIGELDVLRFIKVDGEIMRVGAATTLMEIEESPLLQKEASFLVAAASSVGGPQIRNRATIGGNLLYASPGADMAPPLLALGATLRLVSLKGERQVPIEEFFVGPRRTICRADELLTEVSFPIGKAGRGAFIKLGLRNAMAISVGSVAVYLEIDPSTSIVQEARISLGALAPTPIRIKTLEDMLRGERASAPLIKEVAEAAKRQVHPRSSSIRSSPEYRRAVAGALVQKALEQAILSD